MAGSGTAGESQLPPGLEHHHRYRVGQVDAAVVRAHRQAQAPIVRNGRQDIVGQAGGLAAEQESVALGEARGVMAHRAAGAEGERSEEHTSELQSLMRISYAVFCLKKKRKTNI